MSLLQVTYADMQIVAIVPFFIPILLQRYIAKKVKALLEFHPFLIQSTHTCTKAFKSGCKSLLRCSTTFLSVVGVFLIACANTANTCTLQMQSALILT